MGTLKKYLGAFAIEAANLTYLNNDAPMATTTVFNYKDTGGNTKNTVYFGFQGSYGASVQRAARDYTFKDMIPIATNDALNDFAVDDYAITAVGTTTYSTNRTLTATTATLTYSVNVANNTGADITINCIKFKKQMANNVGSSQTFYDLLCYGYFLDEPITIPNGDSQSIAIAFEIKVQ